MSFESDFHARMVELYHRALERSGGRYKASYFLRTVNEMGGLGTAKKWLHEPEVQSGFIRLWELGILDESMEHAVAFGRGWRPLFTVDERQIARLRFEKYAGTSRASRAARSCRSRRR